MSLRSIALPVSREAFRAIRRSRQWHGPAWVREAWLGDGTA